MISIPVTMETGGVATGVEQIKQQVGSLKSGQVAGTFKSLAQDLAMANGPADMLSATMNRLAISLKGTVLGAAGLALGKLLASPFEQVSALLKQSADMMQQNLSQLNKAGDVLNLQQGVSEANSMQQSIDSIQKAIDKIDGNVFLRVASAITGARKELEGMQTSLEGASNARILEGITRESQTQAFRMGLSPDDQRLFDVSERTRARVQQVRQVTTPGAEQDAAVLEAYAIGARERNDLLDQIAKEKENASKRVRDALDVSEAKQELRVLEAEASGAAAAEAILRKVEEGVQPADASIRQALPPIERSSMQVLADSLQRVGGGGRFAQVGGTETIWRDIAKNTKETAEAVKKGASFDGQSYDIGVQ